MSESQAGFRSAEDFLAGLGIEREPIRVAAPPPGSGVASDQPPPPATSSEGATLDDDVRKALNFIRRSTASQPASEGRLRRKLEARDTPAAAIDLALQRARRERLVDDDALLAALVAERRAKGHARKRIRADLRTRGFTEEQIARCLAPMEAEDPEAVAFEVGRRRAESLKGLDSDTAFRRLVGYLARRGHPEPIARKVAREVVYAAREAERVAGH